MKRALKNSQAAWAGMRLSISEIHCLEAIETGRVPLGTHATCTWSPSSCPHFSPPPPSCSRLQSSHGFCPSLTHRELPLTLPFPDDASVLRNSVSICLRLFCLSYLSWHSPRPVRLLQKRTKKSPLVHQLKYVILEKRRKRKNQPASVKLLLPSHWYSFRAVVNFN